MIYMVRDNCKLPGPVIHRFPMSISVLISDKFFREVKKLRAKHSN